MHRSPRRRCYGVDGPQRCHRVRGALSAVRLLCFDALTVKSCRLIPSSTRWAFWRLSWWRRCLAWGSDERAREPLELVQGFVPLCHVAWVTLSEEWAIKPRPLGGVEEPPSLGHSGRQVPAWPWLGLKVEPRIRPGLPLIRSLELGWAPKSRAWAEGVLMFRPILAKRCTWAYLIGIAPEPLSDPGRIGRGSFGWEPLTPELNISLCLSLVRLSWFFYILL
jgi:hypothetical protein